MVRVEIWYNIHEDFSRSVRKFDCLKPNRELVIFEIYITNIDDQPKWESVDSLGGAVLFVGTNSTFYTLASSLPHSCKGNCIVFSKPRLELACVRGHDIYVANLLTRLIQPLKDSPGFSRMFRPPHDPLNWKEVSCEREGW